MNIDIGPYTIYQRTSYSKMMVFNNETNENISKTDESLANTILENYEIQKNNREEYFEIEKDTIVDVGNRIENEYIEYLFVPEGITTISKFSLSGQEFHYISLPTTLATIENKAFIDCDEMEYLYIPDSVDEIGEGAFDSCKSLIKVKLPSNIENLENELFIGCASLKEINIPNTVTYIGQQTFAGCYDLKNITLPQNLKELGGYVFYTCTNLEKINLPENLEKIGIGAFMDCKSLKEIYIPDGITRLNDTFAGCTNLEFVRLSQNITVLEGNLFHNCSKLKELKLPDSIKKLHNCLFNGAISLENINIPKNLKEIEGSPFASSSIKSLTFNYDLKELNVSYNGEFLIDLILNSNINKLIINSSVKTITAHAFKYSGCQITSIEYLGTKDEFESFKKNNQELFNTMPNIKEINFLEKRLISPENDLIH